MARMTKAQKQARDKRYGMIILAAIVFALVMTFFGTNKGYDEYREEKYQYYTFVYNNNVLAEIRVKPQIFNVMCDDFNDTEHSCTLTNKAHMREFKALVNR